MKTVSELEYGTVVVTGGKHKGKIGYYDNDEGNDCVVYFGAPFLSDYFMIKSKFLQNTNIKKLDLERFIIQQPELANYIGVRS